MNTQALLWPTDVTAERSLMPSLSIDDFDLASTVQSGHLFTHSPTATGAFRIRDGERTFTVAQQGRRIVFSGITETRLRAFFDLDLDVKALHERLRDDRVLAPLLDAYRGVRLVRQDIRQAIVTFILSSNNNQKRIKRMIDHLLSCPEPFAIHDEALLRRAMFGYRAAFLAQATRAVNEEFLTTLRGTSYMEAKALLQTLPGVGPKVADCILAYSALAHGEAFPADVWVRRALTRWYRYRKPFSERHLLPWVARRFGSDAAYAGHYLFLAAQESMRKSQQTR